MKKPRRMCTCWEDLGGLTCQEPGAGCSRRPCQLGGCTRLHALQLPLPPCILEQRHNRHAAAVHQGTGVQ